MRRAAVFTIAVTMVVAVIGCGSTTSTPTTTPISTPMTTTPTSTLTTHPGDFVFELIATKFVKAEHWGWSSLRFALEVRFNTNANVLFTFMGQEAWVQRGMGSELLALNETSPGSYSLDVYVLSDEQFWGNSPRPDEPYATYQINFTGPHPQISQVAPVWTWNATANSYTLDSMSLEVANNGDFPIAIHSVMVMINGSSVVMDLTYPIVVLQGGSESVQGSVMVGGISGGENTLTISLQDWQGESVYSYTSQVTPSR